MSGAPDEVLEPLPAVPCRSCSDGRMGAWTSVRAGSGALSVGELVLVGRVCDRCWAVELQARRARAGTPRPVAPPPRRSPRGELMDGLLRNLRAAVADVWQAVSRGGGRGRAG